VIATQHHEAEDIKVVRLEPTRESSCPLSWSELDDTELVLQVSAGGRWELERTSDSVVFIEQVVMSVVAGRVEEVFGPGRSRIVVTFDDGTHENSTGGRAPTGCLPAPFWPRWGRRVRYEPYR